MKVRLSFSAIERVTPERDPKNILKKYMKKIEKKLTKWSVGNGGRTEERSFALLQVNKIAVTG